MRYSNILIIVLLVTSCDRVNKEEKNDMDIFNLEGKVKILNETSWKVSQVKGIITKGERATMLYSYSFNPKGNLTENGTFWVNGNLFEKETFDYDKNGRNIKKCRYDSSGNLTTKWICNYDNDGNLMEDTLFWNTKQFISRNLYKYEKSKKIEEKYISATGEVIRITLYKYDKNGNQIESITIYPKENKERKTLFKYNSQGKPIEENRYNVNGALKIKLTLKYDNLNNLIEKYCQALDGSFNSKSTFLYSNFDSHNNWLKCITKRNNIPIRITERVIEYYE